MNELLVQNDNAPAEGTAGIAGAIAREQFQIQASFVMAFKNQRDETRSYTRLMKAYERPSAALGAEYSFPRGGKDISGPSVSLARTALRCWGNMRAGFVVVGDDDEGVHLKGEALDLETNSYTFQEAKFKKKIQRKDKKTGKTLWVDPDERELRELINKHGAILERNCILRLIPKDFIDDAVAKAKETLVSAGKKELGASREDTVRKLVMAFHDLGVTQEALEGYLSHKVDIIDEKEYADLRQKYAAIKAGEVSREEFFDLSEGVAEKEINSLTDDLKKAAKGKKDAGPSKEDPKSDSGAVSGANSEQEGQAEVREPQG